MKRIVLNKSLFEGKRIGIALSGGRDSMCLLYALMDMGISPIVIHIEHGIRGEESIRDMKFVEKICESFSLKPRIYNVDAPKRAKEKNISIEQAARELRYEVLDNLINSGEVDRIALAHHANDQAETILMRILRGTGIKGLQGMSADNGKYIRPLLEYTREDIDAYIKENNIEYVEDSTNSEDAYTRNFLRQEIARLKEKYPNLEEAFARLARNAKETEDYISKFVPEVKKEYGYVFINISDLAEKTIACRLIQNGMKELGVLQDVEEKHIEAVLDLTTKESGAYRELSHNIDAYKEGEQIVLAPREKSEYREYPFEIKRIENYEFTLSNEVPDGNELRIIQGNIQNLSKTIYLDADKLGKGVLVRTRKDGDYITKFGGGTKSLGDYLTDKKIPLRVRNKILVGAKDNEVLFICGVEISSKVAIDENTKKVIKVIYK